MYCHTISSHKPSRFMSNISKGNISSIHDHQHICHNHHMLYHRGNSISPSWPHAVATYIVSSHHVSSISCESMHQVLQPNQCNKTYYVSSITLHTVMALINRTSWMISPTIRSHCENVHPHTIH